MAMTIRCSQLPLLACLVFAVFGESSAGFSSDFLESDDAEDSVGVSSDCLRSEDAEDPACLSISMLQTAVGLKHAMVLSKEVIASKSVAKAAQSETKIADARHFALGGANQLRHYPTTPVALGKSWPSVPMASLELLLVSLCLYTFYKSQARTKATPPPAPSPQKDMEETIGQTPSKAPRPVVRELDSFGLLRVILEENIDARRVVGTMCTYALFLVVYQHLACNTGKWGGKDFMYQARSQGRIAVDVWVRAAAMFISLPNEDGLLMAGLGAYHGMGNHTVFQFTSWEPCFLLCWLIIRLSSQWVFAREGLAASGYQPIIALWFLPVYFGARVWATLWHKMVVGFGATPNYATNLASLVVVSGIGLIGLDPGTLIRRFIIDFLRHDPTVYLDSFGLNDFQHSLYCWSYFTLFLFGCYFGPAMVQYASKNLRSPRGSLISGMMYQCFLFGVHMVHPYSNTYSEDYGVLPIDAGGSSPLYPERWTWHIVPLFLNVFQVVFAMGFFASLPSSLDMSIPGQGMMYVYIGHLWFFGGAHHGVSMFGVSLVPSMPDVLALATKVPAPMNGILQIAAMVMYVATFMLVVKLSTEALAFYSKRVHSALVRVPEENARDVGPIMEKADNHDSFPQKYAVDFIDGTWKSFYDFIPDRDDPFMFAGDERKPLTFNALKEFLISPQLDIPGLAREDRLCTAILSSAELAVFYMAYCLRCSFAPLNLMLRPEEFEFEFDDLPARGLVVQHCAHCYSAVEEKATATAIDAAVRKGLPIIMQMIPDKHVVGLFSVETHPAGQRLSPNASVPMDKCFSPLETISRDHIALVLHTSGTTKKPKIVPITHGSMAIGARCHATANCLTKSDVFLNFMPMFHIAGILENLLTTLVSGAKFVALRGQYQPNIFYDALKAEPFPTAYSAVPMHNLTLIQWAEEMEKVDCKPFENHVKYIRNDSAALVPSLALQMENYLKAVVAPAYSMTEANPISSNPRYGVRKLKSVGPTVGPDMVLLHAWPSASKVTEPGQEGEVAVRGACVMKGYEMRPHMDADPNTETFTDGWMRSGDKGWMDADGYLYLIGRFKELINRSGEKISPFEVEDAVRNHKAVKDCLCFSAPHAQFGEAVGCVITLKDEKHRLTIADLREWLETQDILKPMWSPEVLITMPVIPKGPTGKPARINLGKRLELEMLTGDLKEFDHPGL